MLIKLIVAGVIALALMGAVGSFIYAQREIGRAEVRAQLEKERADEEALIQKATEMARQDAVERLKVLTKQRDAMRQQLGVEEQKRAAVNEQLARTNAEYAAWRSVALPAVVSDRLRNYTTPGSQPNNRSVPGRADLSTGQDIALVAEHERATRGIRVPAD